MYNIYLNSVSSGPQAMAFYWKEGQLLIRQRNNDVDDDWTTFSMKTLEKENVVNL